MSRNFSRFFVSNIKQVWLVLVCKLNWSSSISRLVFLFHGRLDGHLHLLLFKVVLNWSSVWLLKVHLRTKLIWRSGYIQKVSLSSLSSNFSISLQFIDKLLVEIHSVSSVVNIEEKQVHIHDHHNNDDNDCHNNSQRLTPKLSFLSRLSNALNDPQNIEQDLNAHCHSSNKSTLLRFAGMVVRPMKEEVPHQSRGGNK